MKWLDKYIEGKVAVAMRQGLDSAVTDVAAASAEREFTKKLGSLRDHYANDHVLREVVVNVATEVVNREKRKMLHSADFYAVIANNFNKLQVNKDE
jgi:hypothetical protein